jgi:hypothetical protein
MFDTYFLADGGAIVNHKKLSAGDFKKLQALMPQKKWVGFMELDDNDILNPAFDKVKFYKDQAEWQNEMLK